MITQLYALEHHDIWHAVAARNEFKREVRGKCGHDFVPISPLTTTRPHPDKYCQGCIGVENKEKEINQIKQMSKLYTMKEHG